MYSTKSGMLMKKIHSFMFSLKNLFKIVYSDQKIFNKAVQRRQLINDLKPLDLAVFPEDDDDGRQQSSQIKSATFIGISVL